MAATTAAVVPAPARTVEPTAESENQAVVERLASSGPAAASLVAATAKVLAAWRHIPFKKKDQPRFSELRCFREGCLVVVKARAVTFQAVSQRLTTTHEFFYYPGARWRSGPLARAGTIETSWVFHPFDPAPTQNQG